ncbi:fimbrial protein [Burkholderia anthina]|uniref:fimbrial protein n=1 Tax=Burkholderia anthina TaxID=179879 RepID=UPI000F5F4FFA|nr:fimbrial protein [Burkholderia anthina]
MKPSTKPRLSASRGWNVLLSLLALGCAPFILSDAARACSFPGDAPPPLSPTLQTSITSNRDAKNPGTLVNSGALSEQQRTTYFIGPDCDGKQYRVRSPGKLVPGITFSYGGKSHPVYETGIPGIGYALMAAVQNGASPLSPWSPVTSDWTQIPVYPSSSDLYARVALVFSGALVSGSYSIPYTKIGDVYLDQGSGGRASAIYMNPLRINITATSCSLTSATQSSVALPELFAPRLASVGDVSTESGTTSLMVNCKQSTGVYVTLTDVVTPTNTGNVLSLAPEATATGIGIQLFKEGSSTPLGFGPDSSLKGNTNQWLAGRVTGSGTLTIPIVAKYVKTAPKITPGHVNARASFTLSYQ